MQLCNLLTLKWYCDFICHLWAKVHQICGNVGDLCSLKSFFGLSIACFRYLCLSHDVVKKELKIDFLDPS